MEKRLVDANNAISVLKILSDKCCDDKSFEQAISVLESVPTIDAVEVTHCRDCRYFIEKSWECMQLYDRFGDEYSDARVCPEYYCANGERKR